MCVTLYIYVYISLNFPCLSRSVSKNIASAKDVQILKNPLNIGYIILVYKTAHLITQG